MGILAAVAVPHPPIILPEIGKGEEKKIQKTIDSYHEAMKFIASFHPETVVILSPHSVMYADYFHISPGNKAQGDFSRFNAPEIKISCDYDEKFTRTLCDICDAENIPAGTEGERQPQLDHGTMIPLYFMKDYLQKCNIVRIGLSGLDAAFHYRFGQCIAEAADRLKRRVAIIASGDLSHKLKPEGPYGFAEEGPKFDDITMQCFETCDFLKLMLLNPRFCDAAAECGLRSYWITAGIFDRVKVTSKVLSHEGPFGVGYGVALFTPQGADENRDLLEQYTQYRKQENLAARAKEDSYVTLARESIEHYLLHARPLPVPENLPNELYSDRAGAFVSIHKNGQLRGCIGTIAPVQNSLAEEIIQNAISASTRDPRFPPINSSELPDLEINVDVLTRPEDISSKDELDPKRYGVIVTRGSRRGLLLPDLEGVDTVDQQINISKQKAGIMPSEEVSLQRFEVIRHK